MECKVKYVRKSFIFIRFSAVLSTVVKKSTINNVLDSLVFILSKKLYTCSSFNVKLLLIPDIVNNICNIFVNEHKPNINMNSR